jgi:hypothetical protein
MSYRHALHLTGKPFVLEIEIGRFSENAVGSPSVVYDTEHDFYVLFFETRLTDTDSECLWGMWGVGVASSKNGIDVWPDPSTLSNRICH